MKTRDNIRQKDTYRRADPIMTVEIKILPGLSLRILESHRQREKTKKNAVPIWSLSKGYLFISNYINLNGYFLNH